MNVLELSGDRFLLALERLAGGHTFTYSGVAFRFDEDGAVECAVPSTWSVANVTAETAETDLRRAELVFQDIASNPEFSKLIAGRPVRFALIYDYGNGSIGLCTRTATGLAWKPGLPKRRG